MCNKYLHHMKHNWSNLKLQSLTLELKWDRHGFVQCSKAFPTWSCSLTRWDRRPFVNWKPHLSLVSNRGHIPIKYHSLGSVSKLEFFFEFWIFFSPTSTVILWCEQWNYSVCSLWWLSWFSTCQLHIFINFHFTILRIM